MPPRSAINQPPMKTRRSNPETMLQSRIMATLGRMDGVTIWRNAVGTAVYEGGARVEYGVGGPGAPDLMMEVTHYNFPVALWLEVKTPGGHVDARQRKWHTAARHGVITPSGRTVGGGRNVAVVRSVDDAVLAVETVMLSGRIVAGFEVEAPSVTSTGEASRG